MTTIHSAGVVLHRPGASGREVLLGHLGGPFWSAKDAGAWSFPKGEREPGEEALAAAVREFAEELGAPVPPGPLVPLGDVRRSGKVVSAWALEGDFDPAALVSNTFELEWPPRSGRLARFPEFDRVGWFPIDAARGKLAAYLEPLLGRLVRHLDGGIPAVEAPHIGGPTGQGNGRSG